MKVIVGWNHVKDRIIGATITSRGPCRRRPKDSPKLNRAEQKKQARDNRKNHPGLSEKDAVRIGNEARCQYLSLNGYLLARWHLKKSAERKQLREAGVDVPEHKLWTGELHPNFAVASDLLQAEKARTCRALIGRYGGPPDEAEAAVLADFTAKDKHKGPAKPLAEPPQPKAPG